MTPPNLFTLLRSIRTFLRYIRPYHTYPTFYNRHSTTHAPSNTAHDGVMSESSNDQDDSIACEKCGLVDFDSTPMLLCDGCNKGFHIDCINPPLICVPEGEWFCTNCVSGDSLANRIDVIFDNDNRNALDGILDDVSDLLPNLAMNEPISPISPVDNTSNDTLVDDKIRAFVNGLSHEMKEKCEEENANKVGELLSALDAFFNTIDVAKREFKSKIDRFKAN